jgi:sugar transferase (PEP-CTERM/EpsH1 system associated)
MRILFLTPRMPFPPNRGGEIIIFNLLKRLSARHEVALVTFYDSDDELRHVARLREYCVRVDMVRRAAKFAPGVLLRAAFGEAYSTSRYRSEEFDRTVRAAVRQFQPNIVQLETFALAQYATCVAQAPTVLHMHDVAWVMWERMAALAPAHLRPLIRLEAERIRSAELAAASRASICVMVSALDAAELSRAARCLPRAPVDIVPGVDCSELIPAIRRAGLRNLVFVGSMGYMPNVDGAVFFVREVLPRIAQMVPDVSLTIVGALPSPAVRRLARYARVSVTGNVENVEPFYAAAAAAVVPLRIGGGVRMKILEALALGVPTVSTNIGVEGLPLQHGSEVLIADSPEELAAASVRLLTDEPLRRTLSARGRVAVERRCTWADAIGAFEAVYDSLARPQRPSAAPIACHA